MRIEINLAAQPYEDVQRFLTTWGLVVGAVGLLTLGLLGYAVQGWARSGTVRGEMAQLRTQIAALESERRAAEAMAGQSQNRQTRDQSRFVNGLIARKAFSWTKALATLEKIVPARVQVVSIRPELNSQQQLEIRLVVAAGSREHALELVRRLEESERFRNAQVSTESTETQGGATDVEFEIVALYVPEAPPVGGKP
jgi:Tfp pilus assembly protein PilN